MEIIITDRHNCLNDQAREFIQRRMAFTLSRFASRIQRVTLTVSDANGPKGGVDKQCKVQVKLHRSAEILITNQDADLKSCISRVVDRTGRTVARSVAQLVGAHRQRKRVSAIAPSVEFDELQ